MIDGIAKQRVLKKELLDAMQNNLSEKALAILPELDINNVRFSLATGYHTTALQLAAFLGMVDVVDALLKRGVDIKEKTTDGLGYTPLHYALKSLIHKSDSESVKNIKSVIKLLINHDASILTTASSCGVTPLHRAVRLENDMDTMRAVRLENDMDTIDTIDVIDIIKYFLRRSPSDIVNIMDNNGNTPLHDAASAKNLEAVKLLIQHGADPRALNNKNRYPHMMTADSKVEAYLMDRFDTLFRRCSLVIGAHQQLTAQLNNQDENADIYPGHIVAQVHKFCTRYKTEQQRTDEYNAKANERAVQDANTLRAYDRARDLTLAGIESERRNRL